MSITMENKVFVRLMFLFLGFSDLMLSCAAVPIARSLLKTNKELPSFVQDLHAQDVMKLNEAGELFGGEKKFNEERMLMEITDYPPTGPNPSHDPPPPAGRA